MILDDGWRFGPYELHEGVVCVLRGRRQIQLTKTEVQLMTALVRQAGEAVGREDLVGAVWAAQMTDDHRLSMHMSRLRGIFGDASIPAAEQGGYRSGVTVERMATQAEAEAFRLCL